MWELPSKFLRAKNLRGAVGGGWAYHKKENFDELQKRWEQNLEIKVMEGKRKAIERD